MGSGSFVRMGRDLRMVSAVTWLQGAGRGALWDEFGLGWCYAGSGQGHVVCSQCALCCASQGDQRTVLPVSVVCLCGAWLGVRASHRPPPFCHRGHAFMRLWWICSRVYAIPKYRGTGRAPPIPAGGGVTGGTIMDRSTRIAVSAIARRPYVIRGSRRCKSDTC
jgi:hypothetical protein